MDKPLTSAESAEVTRWLNNLSVMPSWNGTTSKAVAKSLLEPEWVFCNGDIRDVRVKHLGLGVYKVWTEQRPL